MDLWEPIDPWSDGATLNQLVAKGIYIVARLNNKSDCSEDPF